MLSYIKKYPISLFIILTVIYLSFFKPPKTDLSEIPNLDKLVHICMYFGMSGMLWLEFLRAHRRDNAPLWHAWVGAFLCPILLAAVWSCCKNIARFTGEETGWTLPPTQRERHWRV